eukprot:CAMPEP_0198727550 /NCGR_PEP_ID=MMETSP1475-20131203/4448_1 /TAXON_ID= ORGANISM="Unidentified sp., Strain CCMP1999" /NCGR_SAMPLE_ID=MMETSP1475 /ASSEMBLY_ACC=CAM_ASM_001111 /LENGTH=181 /DNA_ID=CAMNT_0044489603 /DNA_START=302 /DNA_END=848 /DNA_ORIENTATION=+
MGYIFSFLLYSFLNLLDFLGLDNGVCLAQVFLGTCPPVVIAVVFVSVSVFTAEDVFALTLEAEKANLLLAGETAGGILLYTLFVGSSVTSVEAAEVAGSATAVGAGFTSAFKSNPAALAGSALSAFSSEATSATSSTMSALTFSTDSSVVVDSTGALMGVVSRFCCSRKHFEHMLFVEGLP